MPEGDLGGHRKQLHGGARVAWWVLMWVPPSGSLSRMWHKKPTKRPDGLVARVFRSPRTNPESQNVGRSDIIRGVLGSRAPRSHSSDILRYPEELSLHPRPQPTGGCGGGPDSRSPAGAAAGPAGRPICSAGHRKWSDPEFQCIWGWDP